MHGIAAATSSAIPDLRRFATGLRLDLAALLAEQFRVITCDTRGRVARIDAPTLVVGDRDEFVPPQVAARLYHWLPNAELAIMPGDLRAGGGGLPAATLRSGRLGK